MRVSPEADRKPPGRTLRRPLNLSSRARGGSGNRGLLTQNLSFLSTSAPAVSFRVDPSVSRRGTCDRRICKKPLARRTRRSYGFCVRDSRFVRGGVGLSGLVKDVGESVGRSEEAIRCGEFRRVSGGWRWISVSTDTTAVGAEARVVESDLVG